MSNQEILNAFAEYIEYDSKQNHFILNSNNYKYNRAGKRIEMLLNGFDKNGIISVLYAKYIFEEIQKQTVYSVKSYDIISNPETEVKLIEKIKKDKAIYQIFKSNNVKSKEQQIIEEVNAIIAASSDGIKSIKESTAANIDSLFKESIINTVEGIGKCKENVFLNGEQVQKISKFHTRILVFEQMADCLIYMEKADDAIYLCYINEFDSADGYFTYIIKSNGTIISVNDKVNERFMGQHMNSRNGRWTEDHADSIFPYDFIFNYSGHDYKGYATKYIIDDTKLDFVNLTPEIYYPIIISMMMLINKYEGYKPEKDPLYISSLMKTNFIEEHSENELVEIQNNPIVVYNNNYTAVFNNDKILSGEYDDLYQKDGIFGYGQFWVDRYGKGFVYNAKNLFNTRALLENRSDNPSAIIPEFIGDKRKMDVEAYRQIRIQLANYIKEKMQEEVEAFGGYEGIMEWWHNKAASLKQKFTEIGLWYYDMQSHPEEMEKEKAKARQEREEWKNQFLKDKKNSDKNPKYYTGNFINRISITEKFPSYNSNIIVDPQNCLNETRCRANSYSKHYINEWLDDTDSYRCNVYISFSFANYMEMKNFIGENVPLIIEGWNALDGKCMAAGNSLLDICDAVSFITSPVYQPIKTKNEYKRKCNFNIAIGFSKRHWNKLYKEYCKQKQIQKEGV